MDPANNYPGAGFPVHMQGHLKSPEEQSLDSKVKEHCKLFQETITLFRNSIAEGDRQNSTHWLKQLETAWDDALAMVSRCSNKNINSVIDLTIVCIGLLPIISPKSSPNHMREDRLASTIDSLNNVNQTTQVKIDFAKRFADLEREKSSIEPFDSVELLIGCISLKLEILSPKPLSSKNLSPLPVNSAPALQSIIEMNCSKINAWVAEGMSSNDKKLDKMEFRILFKIKLQQLVHLSSILGLETRHFELESLISDYERVSGLPLFPLSKGGQRGAGAAAADF